MITRYLTTFSHPRSICLNLRRIFSGAPRLQELSKKVDYCIRCGKCKTDCCVYYPARGMFYHPRNKNLAIGSLIEALLFDAQRERTTDFALLQWLEEVADHCTICHKCLKPCPVDIDSGEVSVLEREILSEWGFKHSSPVTELTLRYLESRSPAFNALFPPCCASGRRGRSACRQQTLFVAAAGK